MTESTSQHAPGGWVITGQTETSKLAPSGQFVDGYIVSFMTAAGIDGTVFVPRVNYTPDFVRTVVESHAQTLDAVAALTPGS